MPERYEPQTFEAKWRKKWKEAELFKTREEPGREKYYCLDFFPYPSGAGLSVGHCRNYIPGDVLARTKFMQGYNVLHPMGFDAFGLPAENEAIKRGIPPGPMVESYAENYKRQLDLVGIGYDWSRSFRSSDPDYYKWTQWIFELLFKRGLAYQKLAAVNWDPVDKTVLADEEIIGGRAERSGALVEKRYIPQWFFKITEYAQRLIDDLDLVDWPEGIKLQQRNWIGRSEGVQFRMKVDLGGAGYEADDSGFEVKRSERELNFEVFTTRIDTVFGVTFAVLAPEHPLVDTLIKLGGAGGSPATEHAKAVTEYREQAKRLSDQDRLATTREKTGVFTGFYAINPVNGAKVPIWVADYVLINYGTGAIMAVPGHDERDYEFAQKQGLGIARVIQQSGEMPFEKAFDRTRELINAWIRHGRSGNQDNRLAFQQRVWSALQGLTRQLLGHAGQDEIREFLIDASEQYVQEMAPGAGDAFGTEAQLIVELAEDLADYVTLTDEFLEPLFNPELPFHATDGTLVHSEEYSGLTVIEAQERLAQWFEERGLGQRKIQYKLRDWLISRQRYWGCPIPIIHTQEGDMHVVGEECLPVLLPEVDNIEPPGDGTSPLALIPEFVNVTDKDGRLGRRETDTMGGFACSSWYFLRFADPYNADRAWDAEKAKYWMPVDTYIGGAEHAVMHLLYARFWTKVLYDEGLVTVKEPFQRLRNQGQVLALTPYRKPKAGETLQVGEDAVQISFEEAAAMPKDEVIWRWARMSKSKGNVVTPDEVVEKEGADALRVYELFVAPFDADVQWSSEGLQGIVRFLNRVFKLVEDGKSNWEPNWRAHIGMAEPDGVSTKVRRLTHQTIKKVTDDIDRFGFNTYISSMMIFSNGLIETSRTGNLSSSAQLAMSEAIETFILLLSPAAPHSADELWHNLGQEGFTYHQEWPSYSEDIAREDVVNIAIQVNGKLRDTMEMSTGASNEDLEAAAKERPKIKQMLEGLTVRKVIVVPNKLVNIVAN